jgi:NTP pyrophosphatase (non-canonical NTP hydrolase)
MSSNPNPWIPMKRPRDIKVIGKYLEELGECVAAGARSLIQGLLEKEPVTGKVNKEWLEEEIADVLGNAELVIEHFDLDETRIRKRAERKKAFLRDWHEMVE